VLNLFIALFWLVLGLGLIFIPGCDGWRIRGTDLSFGWVAIGLAGYNLLRWWVSRPQQPRRKHGDDESPPSEYHPEFDFSDRDKPKP